MESFECFEAISASDAMGSCSGIVSGFAGVAESTDFPGLTSEMCLPILANRRRIYEEVTGDSESGDGRSQLGVEKGLTDRLEGTLRGAKRGWSNLLYIKMK